MITVKLLSFLLLVAFLVFGPGTAFDNFDPFRNLAHATPPTSQNIDVIGKFCPCPRSKGSKVSPEDACSKKPWCSSLTSSMSASISNNVSESCLASLSSFQSAIETASCVVGDSNTRSHGLTLKAGQFAGIFVAVFIVSSVSSIFATIFILRYRKQRTNITDKTPHSQAEARTPQPMFNKIRGDIFSSSYPSATGGQRDAPADFTPRWPPQNHEANPSANRTPFTPSSGNSLSSDQVHPVSPLSDQPSDESMQDKSPSLELGLYGNRTQIASRSRTTNTPPIKLSLSRGTTQDGSHQIKVVHMGVQESIPHPLLSNAPMTEILPSDDKLVALQEGPDMRDSIDHMGEGTVISSPIPNISTLVPPIVPLRFSSLNAYRGFLIQRSMSSHGNDETFLLSTDEESADSNHEILQDRTRLQSSSYSSVISQDLTQFDPRGMGQQPMSRLSMSSAQLSLGYSASSTSPLPQYRQQEEYPEFSPLRPAPMSPSQ
ncbi:hypothetical protein GGS24DRAFT_501353 [Hypoxylon argillaceum]|nr:hypothetical protein GGS24DRAFT_501353 [Hypoxylon argillaceum]